VATVHVRAEAPPASGGTLNNLAPVARDAIEDMPG